MNSCHVFYSSPNDAELLASPSGSKSNHTNIGFLTLVHTLNPVKQKIEAALFEEN